MKIPCIKSLLLLFDEHQLPTYAVQCRSDKLNDQTARLAEVFRESALADCQMGAPFYEAIAKQISRDEEILRIAEHTAPQQPPPNMLLAAVRYLLNQGGDQVLSNLYPPTKSSGWPEETYTRFRQFVLEHSDQIIQLLQTRNVQSNVVRRAALLVFGLYSVREAIPAGPLVNIEMGCSLGLTLGWQIFGYRYGNRLTLGDTDSPAQVVTDIRGNGLPKSFTNLPEVDRNIGIEIQPIDIQDKDSVDWLEALIWPEHEDNLRLSRAATDLMKTVPQKVHAGNAADVLPELLETLPPDTAVNLYHSHSWNQMDDETRMRIDLTLESASLHCPVFRLSLERVAQNSELNLIRYLDGIKAPPVFLAECETHGRWIRPSEILSE